MMRAFFITMIVLSLIYVVAAFAIVSVVDDYNWSASYSYDYSYDSYDYDSYYSSFDSYYYEEQADNATMAGGFLSLLYMLLAAVTFLLALLRIKTPTMKVLSIIGLSLAGIFLFWSFLPLTSPGGVGFDEVGPFFGICGIALLGLHIVGMIHAFKTST